jgi:hypothetical protein
MNGIASETSFLAMTSEPWGDCFGTKVPRKDKHYRTVIASECNERGNLGHEDGIVVVVFS